MSIFFKVDKLHPETIKHVTKGHPWITRDSFSNKWPKNSTLLHINLQNNKSTYTFIHDPNHPFCVGRKISETQIKTASELEKLINDNLEKSFQSRINLQLFKKRNHFYLVFGEADFLPGLFILFLNGRILIQTHMHFWDNEIKNIIKFLKIIFTKYDFKYKNFWWQKRQSLQEPALLFNENNFINCVDHFHVEELGFLMSVKLGDKYDHGIYTDMSSVRSLLSKRLDLFIGNSVLNLFSYTGAFTVFSLKFGASFCTSVDVSSTYQKILESNLSINSINTQSHQAMISDVMNGIKKIQDQKKKYDLIILDPPSSFTSNKKKVHAMTIYPELLKVMDKIASSKANLLCFLNFHQKTKNQFRKMIETSLPNWIINETYSLGEDAPLLPYFPEGDYLKGVLLSRKK